MMIVCVYSPQVLLHEFDVPNSAFSAEVMACLPPAGWKITEDLVRQRADLCRFMYPSLTVQPYNVPL